MNCIYIRRCFNICEVFSDIKKWYLLFELLTSKQFYIKKYFLISKNFLTSSNYFLISEIRIQYKKLFYEIRQIYLLILWIKGNFFIWKKIEYLISGYRFLISKNHFYIMISNNRFLISEKNIELLSTQWMFPVMQLCSLVKTCFKPVDAC